MRLPPVSFGPACRASASIALLLVAGAARAQAPVAAAPHLSDSPEIVVSAPYPRETFYVLSGVSVLAGEALTRSLTPTIGETLARLPGVSSTYFGPNASRPVLRGQQGERVRVLVDGIGSFDASNTSVDHAVAVSPFAAERIEVIRGPEVLLYGSSAIGGVVNSIDRRIPRERVAEDLHVDALGTFGSAATQGIVAGAVDMPVGERFAIHLDGSWLKGGDVRTGGFIYSEQVRRAAAAAGLPEDAYNISGKLPNSQAQGWDVAGGIGFFFGNQGRAGVSATRLQSTYGIPNRLAIDPSIDFEEDISIDMRQTRVDIAFETPLMSGFIEQVQLRGGYADYVHDEVEEDGSIGTTFTSRGGELRVEAVQAERNGWKGASGIQFFGRNLDSIGAEAYLPQNETQMLGLFTLQEVDLSFARAEVSLRYENARVVSDPVGFDRDFNAISGSVGASIPLGSLFRFGIAYTHAERAPAAEELLSDGPHLATQSYEIGNPDLDRERSNGFETTLRGRGTSWQADLAFFWTSFGNFIYQQPTGTIEDGLPVFLYAQQGATFLGLEFDSAFTILERGDTQVNATLMLDWVKATLDNGAPVPLIPPLRSIAGIEATGGAIGGRFEIELAAQQDRVPDFQTTTPGFAMLNASLFWKPWGANSKTMLLLVMNNLTDSEARRASSVIRDFAPLPGRDIRLTLQTSF